MQGNLTMHMSLASKQQSVRSRQAAAGLSCSFQTLLTYTIRYSIFVVAHDCQIAFLQAVLPAPSGLTWCAHDLQATLLLHTGRKQHRMSLQLLRRPILSHVRVPGRYACACCPFQAVA
jgi:hypothetical protein